MTVDEARAHLERLAAELGCDPYTIALEMIAELATTLQLRSRKEQPAPVSSGFEGEEP